MDGYSQYTCYTTADSGKSSPLKTHSSHLPAPQISANSWAILNIQTGECLWGKNVNAVRDIASLTKIMTLFVVKQCIRHKLVSESDLVTVPREATLLGGTTAFLRSNDRIQLIDLLYGLMLPSGNDAAYTLADFCGGLMLTDPRINKKKCALPNVDFFVKQMNVWAKQLKLKNTLFLNPHGLSHLGNHSSAYDISRVACLLVKRPLISQIVATIKHTCLVENGETSRKLVWVNTNLLLGRDAVTGFKTGQTQTAGPCLCATFQKNGVSLCITVLKTRNPDKRWVEVKKLYDWAMSELEIFFSSNNKDMSCKRLANLINTYSHL